MASKRWALLFWVWASVTRVLTFCASKKGGQESFIQMTRGNQNRSLQPIMGPSNIRPRIGFIFPSQKVFASRIVANPWHVKAIAAVAADLCVPHGRFTIKVPQTAHQKQIEFRWVRNLSAGLVACFVGTKAPELLSSPECCTSTRQPSFDVSSMNVSWLLG